MILLALGGRRGRGPGPGAWEGLGGGDGWQGLLSGLGVCWQGQPLASPHCSAHVRPALAFWTALTTPTQLPSLPPGSGVQAHRAVDDLVVAQEGHLVDAGVDEVSPVVGEPLLGGGLVLERR